ncbi:MAG TPA: TetR/AcrR family transcriptional regulator [Thermoanaerobaculia bacterium]|nr:TetR/AcrR family transcriptional regulator [Thermoanaerobaculia bacterium]
MNRPLLASADALPSPPRQARSVEKRAKLLEAGRALFREKGYEATPIAEITTRAGMASGAFYLYFRSKKQLLVVLMNELTERLGNLNLSAPKDLRSFIASLFRTDLEYFGVVRAWHEAILTDPELRAMHAEIEAWTHARILNLFRALQPRPDADVAAFARMMDRHFWSLLARASTLTPRELQRETRLAADVISRYLFP